MADKIKCPNCGHKFDVEEALAEKLEADLKARFERKASEQAKKLNEERDKLIAEKKRIDEASRQLDDLKSKQDEMLAEQLEKALQQEREKIEEERRKIDEKQKRQDKILEERLGKALESERFKIDEERQKLAELQSKQDELTAKEVERKLKIERERIEKTALENFESKIELLEKENEERRKENKALREKEINLLEKEKKLKEQQDDMEIKMREQLLKESEAIEAKAKEAERQNFEMERRQLLKQIEDNKKLAEEMRRKAEQGSMQLQGEVQELAIEELLKQKYPFDRIEEVAKGKRGADCIQHVVGASMQECGAIVYESKRTKAFSKDWIEKLKQDMTREKADVAVLVTQTMPSDMERFGERDGIWICRFGEIESLSFVLREMILRTHAVKSAEENKGDKMELLYNYLTSTEFSSKIERIVENYDAMITQLNSEKKAMHKIWATREKQIWVVQENLSALFGAVGGIAGNELPGANFLQLIDSDDPE